MSIVFRDFGTAYLAAPLTVGGLSITVDNPTWLPTLAAGDYFYLVLQKYSDRSYVEIVKCTATAGSVLTIVRAQSGTAARSFALGDYVELRLTSDGFAEFVAQGIATKIDKSGGDFSGLVRFLAASGPRYDLVRTSDSVACGVTLDYTASEGHRTIIGGATGSNAVTPSLLLRPNGYGNDTGQLKVGSDGLVNGVSFEMRAAQQTKINSLVRYDTLSSYTPTSRTINAHALTSDFSITADEVFSAGAVVNADAQFKGADFQYRRADGVYGVRLAAAGAVCGIQAGKTDTSTDQKMHLSGWAGMQLSEFKVYADNPLVRREAGVDYPLYDALNKPAIADVTGLADALLQAATQIAAMQPPVAKIPDYGSFGFRNVIINGAMEVSQRGVSFPNIVSGSFATDRWRVGESTSGAVTVSRENDGPAGSGIFYCLRATVTSVAASLAASDWAGIEQPIEGFFSAQLYGRPVTLSFWVKSSLAGKYCASLGTGAPASVFVAEFAVLNAGVWERKEISIPSVYVNSGSSYSEAIGANLRFALCAGSSFISEPNKWGPANAVATPSQVNFMATVGNTFAITGVQLEVGKATEFEHRPLPMELLMCQRYFFRNYGVVQYAATCYGDWGVGCTVACFQIELPVTMRRAPTAKFTGGYVRAASGGSAGDISGISFEMFSGTALYAEATIPVANLIGGQSSRVVFANADVQLDAEL